MENLLSFTLTELRTAFEEEGIKPYRADQIFKWLYKKKVNDFSLMTDLPKDLRETLSEKYATSSLKLIERVKAPDSEKFLFGTFDGHRVETVLIKERDHLTLCVSTQIGCAVGCRFCSTAVDGLIRNLTADEIIDQYLQVARITGAKIRNVVFMGMGEPLANYLNLRKAVEIMVSPWGLDLSKRRVTVSTSGLIAPLRKMTKDPLLRDVNLAVSVNSPFETERENLMPLLKEGSLTELMEILYQFPLRPYRKITLEYVLINGVNDSQDHARALARLVHPKRKKFKVNLIPFNPSPELPFSRPPLERVMEFQRILWKEGISTFVRFSKGFETFGACGQLRARRTMLKSLTDEGDPQMAD
jgi:23S rRNA (adenine2503-C2)-methyltransferase